MKTLFLLLSLYSCAQGSIKIASEPPGATVISDDGQGPVVLGQTPLNLSSTSVPPLTTLTFQKDGFTSESLLLVSDKTRSVDVRVSLEQVKDDFRSADLAQRFEKLARELVIAHNLITQKRLREAESILQSLTREFPKVSVPHDLLGNIAFLEKDRSKALQHYEKSLKLNPENGETQSMISRLKDQP